MKRLRSAETQISDFIERLAYVTKQTQRVCRQRYALNLTDEHCADVIGFACNDSAMRFGQLFGSAEPPEDAVIASMIEGMREKHPETFETPTRMEYESALIRRGVSNPSTYTNTQNAEQIRRAHYALAADH